MFEHFTEKAIKVINYAQEEAYAAKHLKLYPEHILLGILMEGSGVAARFLKSSGLKTEVLQEKIKKIVESKQSEVNFSETRFFSSSVKMVLVGAWDEAKSFGVNYITPEHLFLSLLYEENNTITGLLKELKIDIDKIRSGIIKVIEKKGKSYSHPENLQKPYSFISEFAISSIFNEASLTQIMNSAGEKLKNTGYEAIGTEQIFLAMLEDKSSTLSLLLESEGITHQNFVEKLSILKSRNDEYDKDESIFTPKAFFAINSSYELAKELGSAEIKPEHILLGILKEKQGIAYKILCETGIDTDSLYSKIIKPIEKQKPVTLTIIRLAKEEAKRLGHNIVGTEQFLLGILGEGTGIAAKVLKNLGITIKDVRIEVEKIIGYGNSNLEKEMSFTPRAKRLLELAWNKAKKFNHPRIESEHLLLAITREKECMAMKILENLGVDALEIRQGILKILGEEKTEF
ncbi:MAG: Clp protease N-terminal domain-containing protein [bacterium]